jgi:hypothetical protein
MGGGLDDYPGQFLPAVHGDQLARQYPGIQAANFGYPQQAIHDPGNH